MSTSELVRYRLDVLGSTVDDVVRAAGGWLFDRATAGWDVRVLLANGGDVRPLQILGARALDLESGWQPIAPANPSPALAVGADVFESDARVHRDVLAAVDGGLTEVTLWGTARSVELDGSVERAQHVLSTAARAFKAHALAAAGLSGKRLAAIEAFRISATGCAPEDPELPPAG